MNLRTSRCDSRRIAVAIGDGCLQRRSVSVLALLASAFVASQVSATPQWGSRSTQSAPSSQSSQGGAARPTQSAASPGGTDSAPATSDAPAAAQTSFVQLTTSMGPIVIELDEASAPLTCANFIEYVKGGFYDGTCFHRVVPSFVVQAGGFSTDLVQKPAKEPIKSEWKASVKNKRGAVAMSRLSNRPDSATSQFFINVADNAGFDSARDGAGYTVFGRVVEGMPVVDKMSRVQTATTKGMRDVPVQPVVIEKAEWSATRPESGSKSSGATPGAASASSGTTTADSAASHDPAAAAKLDPTLWSPSMLVFSWAQTPSQIESVSTATQVTVEGGRGKRILYGPAENVSPGVQSISVLAKAGTIDLLQLCANGSKGFFANFDLKKGVVTHKGDTTPTATIEDLGDGWYRLTANYDYRGTEASISIRRLAVIDDPLAEWHAESARRGHFFVASPKSGVVGSP
jgi:peptidyl-prolyl cis-trans isomerase A (cyclophilin A)